MFPGISLPPVIAASAASPWASLTPRLCPELAVETRQTSPWLWAAHSELEINSVGVTSAKRPVQPPSFTR